MPEKIPKLSNIRRTRFDPEPDGRTKEILLSNLGYYEIVNYLFKWRSAVPAGGKLRKPVNHRYGFSLLCLWVAAAKVL